MAMTWAQFTAIPNGTRVYNHYADECVALANLFHEDVIGGSFVPVNSAYQWWTNFGSYGTLTSNYTQSASPVAGAIAVWKGGIYNAVHGHIGVVTSVNGNGTYNTMEQNAGTWRYVGRYTRNMSNVLGFLIPKNNPAGPTPVAANQRQVGANVVKRRQGPSTSSAELPDPLQPGTVGNFNGWIYGEQVNDGVANTNVWYRGTSGNFFWAGGFTKISGDGLENLNPTPPPTPTNPADRIVGANTARKRSTASTSGNIVGELAANTKVTFDGWVTGQQVSDSVATSDVWYHHAEGWFAWAGAFTAISKDGLKDMNVPVPPTPPTPPTPPVPPEPPVPPTPGRKPVSETTPNWDMSAPAQNPVYPRPVAKASGVKMPANIVERIEAVSVNGYTTGRPDPLGPNHIVIHHAASDSLSGVVNTLRGTNGAPTASYAVKDNELVAMVPEEDSPWTNGRWTSNMYSVTFEMCNAGPAVNGVWPAPSAATMETVAYAMARAAQRWNIELPLEHGVNVFGHKDVSKSATSCPGATDVRKLVARANEIIAASPVTPPAPPAPSIDVLAIAEHLDAISAILKGK